MLFLICCGNLCIFRAPVSTVLYPAFVSCRHTRSVVMLYSFFVSQIYLISNIIIIVIVIVIL